jgi:hypothetical protein
MSTNKCFENLNTTVVDGSDRINAIRQKTIYKELQNNAMAGAPDPIKNTGYRYNENFKTIALQSTEGEIKYELSSAKNHELLLDITKGKRFANPILNVGHDRYKIWGGNVMNVSYRDKSSPLLLVKYKKLCNMEEMNTEEGNDTNVIYIPYTQSGIGKDSMCYTDGPESTKTIIYNIIDQYHNVFYTPCYFSGPAHIPPWIKTTVSKTPAFRDSYYYLQGARANPLAGFAFPQKVLASHQEQCIQNNSICRDICNK